VAHLPWILAWGASLAATAAPPELPALDTLLDRLSRVATLYRDQALQFTCDETITHVGPSVTEVHRFRYIYRYSGPEKQLMDWREPRGRAAEQSRRKQERARLDHYGLPVFVERAYSWIFVFEKDKQPLFRYAIEGPDVALDRPAIRVRFDAVPPFHDGVNEWCGTAWVDRESWQLLRVEAVQGSDCAAAAQLEARLAGRNSTEALQGFNLTAVTTEFDVVENGMRFPGRVVARRTMYHVETIGGRTSKRETPEFKVTQTYKRYRFFGVRTHEEIRRVVEGPRAQ
jgi:hypothetical protein